jgi:hypothetical protein
MCIQFLQGNRDGDFTKLIAVAVLSPTAPTIPLKRVMVRMLDVPFPASTVLCTQHHAHFMNKVFWLVGTAKSPVDLSRALVEKAQVE